MLLMEYSSIRGEDLPDLDEDSTWNLFRAYIDARSQRLMDKYPGYGVKAIK